MNKSKMEYVNNLAELLMEAGQQQCVNYNCICNMRPCTAAQSVFCCQECEFNKNCTSKCRKGQKGVNNEKENRSREKSAGEI